MRRDGARVALLGLVALGLVACGPDSGASPSGGDFVQIQASFYPLAWMAEEVGGDHVHVESLTEPGAEPHDLELTPSDVAAVSDADLVVYLEGFQPAVDEAVDQAGGDAAFDAAPAADLDLTVDDAVDRHFWLDPTRLATVAEAFADALASTDPDHADDYAANLAALTDRLGALDREMAAGLATCARRDLVTSHDAFGYLARRYDLHQVGISGVTPEEEPSPSDLADVTDFVEEHDVTTIYFETLVNPDVSRAVADEAGVDIAVLDPIEGLDEASQGDDYLEVMAANLVNLRRGQGCS